MEREKLIFGDGSTLEYDAISVRGGQMTVSVHNGIFDELETKFADVQNLEKVYQADAAGNKMAAHKNYTILVSLTKRKGVVIDEITETTADIVDVTLEQEPEWKTEARKLAEVYGGAIADLGEITSALAEQMEGGAQ